MNNDTMMKQFGDMHMKVREFQKKMGFPSQDKPTEMKMKMLFKRIRLIAEEEFELIQAIDENNFMKMVDAYGDLLYVVIGFGATLGLPTQAIFDEVHRSNMTKVGMNEHMKGGKGEGFEQPDLESVMVDHGTIFEDLLE